MVEVNGSIDALLNSPEMFFEVANDLSASLSKVLGDDDTQLVSVVKTLFDVVSSRAFTVLKFTHFTGFLVQVVEKVAKCHEVSI